MKKILGLLGLAVIVIAAGYGLKKWRPSVAAPTAGGVVVSGYVPYTLVKQLGGEETAVEMLLPPNAEPHSFEPSPGTLVQVHKAALFVYVSGALEPWVQDVLGAAGKDTKVVELAAGLPQAQDPHVWMDFGFIVDMARTLTAALVEKDPSRTAQYQQNLTRFEQEIALLDREFATALKDCQSREIVHIGHLAFSALAKRYGLSLTALAGASHDAEQSVRKVADLVKHIRAEKVPALFTEEEVSPRLAQAVAAETSAEIFPLYTIEHVTKTDFDQAVTYAQLMRRNLESLQKGLKCRK